MAQEHAKNNDCRTTTVCCFDSPSPSSLLSIRHVQDLSETVSKAMSLGLPHHGPNIGARCGGWWSRDIIAAVLVGLSLPPSIGSIMLVYVGPGTFRSFAACRRSLSSALRARLSGSNLLGDKSKDENIRGRKMEGWQN